MRGGWLAAAAAGPPRRAQHAHACARAACITAGHAEAAHRGPCYPAVPACCAVSIDGKETKVVTEWFTGGGDSAPFPAPFDQTFSIVLNVAVGGAWPGPPDATTPPSATMAVDWVRVLGQLEEDDAK